MFGVSDLDVERFGRFENMLGALGDHGPKAESRAINRTGDMARTQVVRALSAQTGLPQKFIRGSVHVRRASSGNLVYILRSIGGEVPLKYFKKRETQEGVVADLGVRGRELFPRTFFKGGTFPRRKFLPAFKGDVLERGSERMHLYRVKSGVVIPEEMVSGATRDAFEDSVEKNLPRRMEHEINRLLGL